MIDEATKRFLFKNPDVTSVSYGFKYTAGVKTSVRCIIVGVKAKKPRGAVLRGRMIPHAVGAMITDVQERDIEALSYTGRKRPCSPGFSIGHVAITAGTLGAYVKHGTSDDWWILSNNHVLAASNQGKVNDKIIQPGKADGGFSDRDLFAWLRVFVTINWDNGNGGNGCNLLSRMWMKLRRIRAVRQPHPNLVDAAIAMPVNQGHVARPFPGLGTIAQGFERLILGENVCKVGRTTEVTHGAIEGVGAMIRVQYSNGTATYNDQLEIRTREGKEFSAGGDSGSVILTEDGRLIGGLLFAGGSGVTIANPIGHVIDLLDISL